MKLLSDNKKLPQNRIAELRKRKKLSQAQLAKETGLTRQAISLYEIGKREPKLETWMKLAEFFDVPISYITGASNEPNKDTGRLQNIREDKGMSYQQVADAYNQEADGLPAFDHKEKHISAETIQAIEAGKYQPSKHEWQLLAWGLNVPQFYLAGQSNDKVGWQEWAEATGHSSESLQQEVKRLIETGRLDKEADIQHQIGYAVKSLDFHAPTTTSGVINGVQSRLIELRRYVNNAFLEKKYTPLTPGSKIGVIKPGDIKVREDMDEDVYNKLIDIINNARWEIAKLHSKK